MRSLSNDALFQQAPLNLNLNTILSFWLSVSHHLTAILYRLWDLEAEAFGFEFKV